MRRCLAVLVLAVAGCGESSADRPPAPPAVTLGDTVPRSGVYAVGGARAVPAGATRITVRNDTRRERGAQLVRVDRGRAAAQVLAAVRAVGEGKPMPAWMHWAGGLGVVRPGTTSTFTVTLRRGRHYVVDRSYRGRRAPAESGTFLDVGRAGEAAVLPRAPATITAREYRFVARGLAAGPLVTRLRNAGRQPHDFVIAPILAGRTLADVRAFATGESEEGPPPVDFAREVISGALAPGTAQTMRLNLRPGRYALLCFTSDRRGGPPHVVSGMIAQATVR